jgi:hypothetical protein
VSSAKKFEDLYHDSKSTLSEEKASLELLVNKLKEEIESDTETQKKMADILSLYIKDS